MIGPFKRQKKVIPALRQYVLNSANQQALANAETTPAIPDTSASITQNYLTNTLLNISPVEIFNIISANSLVHVGQISSGYESHSYGITIEATLGSTIDLMGQEIGLELTAGIGGSFTQFQLIIIQRLPDTILLLGVGPGGTNVLKRTPNPILMSNLKGKSWNFNLGVSFFAGLSLEGPEINIGSSLIDNANSFIGSVSNDAFAIADTVSLSMEVSATASGSMSGTLMNLADTNPTWFPSTADKNFLLELEVNVGIVNRKIILGEIIAWLKQTYPTVTEVEDCLSLAQGFFKPNFSTNYVIMALDYALSYENKITARTPGAPLTPNMAKMMHYRFLAGIVISDYFETGNADYTKIIQKLNNLGFQPPSQNYSSIDFTRGRYILSNSVTGKEISVYPPNTITVYRFYFTNTYLEIYEERGTQKNLLRRVRLLPKPLYLAKPEYFENINPAITKLSYWGAEGGTEAGLEAKILDSGFEGKATGLIKKAKYRYQNYARINGNGKLIITHDVAITYKQITLGAGLNVVGIERGAERSFNNVTYRGSIAVWSPFSSSTQYSQNGVPALDGSGVFFGASISIKLLNKWSTLSANHPTKLKYANALHITVASLDAVINGLSTNYGPVFTEESLGAEYVLLESSHVAIDQYVNYVELGQPQNTDPILDNTTMQTWINKYIGVSTQTRQATSTYQSSTPGQTPSPTTPADFQPSIVRARIRMADSITEKGKNINLSFSLGLVGIGIKLSSVREAGSIGCIDAYVYDLIKQCEYIPSGTAATGQQTYVGPAALLFQ